MRAFILFLAPAHHGIGGKCPTLARHIEVSPLLAHGPVSDGPGLDVEAGSAHSARRICQPDVINSQRSPGLGLTRSVVLIAFSWVLRDAVSISIRLLSILGPSRCSEGPVCAPLTITRRCGYWRARRPASRMRSLVPPSAITPMSLSGSWIFPCAPPRTAPLPWPWAVTPQRRAAWRAATSATGSSWLRGRRWSSERAASLPIAPSLTDWGGKNVERILAFPTWP